MANNKCDIDELADAILAAFNEYSADVAEDCKKACKQVATQCRSEIKANSPVSADEETKHYANGWSTKVVGQSSQNIQVVVYNRLKPGLAHLLENGHALRNGGRVEGRPHIAPAEAKANDELLRRIKEIVQK